MPVTELAVAGAYALIPRQYDDHRGTVAVPFHDEEFIAVTGHELFPVRQTIHSRTRRGGVRGIHYTACSPGTAKLVHCPYGRVTDIVVDLRIGSPTFGTVDSVVLDDQALTAVYLPVGVGHAYVAEQDGSVVSYLLSQVYRVDQERSVSVLDPVLRLPLPAAADLLLSERDRGAPTLAEAAAAGLLPALGNTE